MQSEIIRVFVDCSYSEKVAEVFYSSGFSRVFVGKLPKTVVNFCKTHFATDLCDQVWLYK